MASSHTTIRSPQPDLRSLVVTVEESVFAKNPFILPVRGTRYEDFDRAIFGHSYQKQFNDYLYVNQVGDHGLLFAPYKTVEEANQPFDREWTKFGNHRWHPILKNLVLLEDFSFPRSTNIIQNGQQGFATGPSYNDRYIYVPDVNEGSRFFTEEYFGPRPFVIPRYRVPIPTGVQYSVGDLRGSFQESLHDDIEIPVGRTSNAVYLGGAAYSASGSVDGQFFPRTNFKTWLPYVVYDEQQLTDSGYSRKRIRVFPPSRPKAIRRA